MAEREPPGASWRRGSFVSPPPQLRSLVAGHTRSDSWALAQGLPGPPLERGAERDTRGHLVPSGTHHTPTSGPQLTCLSLWLCVSASLTSSVGESARALEGPGREGWKERQMDGGRKGGGVMGRMHGPHHVHLDWVFQCSDLGARLQG